jgi:hypothetical protein
MLIHMGMSWIAVLASKLWWDSMFLHSLVLIFNLALATWNGAQFYFKVGPFVFGHVWLLFSFLGGGGGDS